MMYTTQEVARAIVNFLNMQEYDGFAILCAQKSEAECLLSALHSLGCYWSEKQPIISDDGSIILKWKYKENTCYRFFISKRDVFSAQKSFYERKELTVYTFQELMQYGESEKENAPASSGFANNASEEILAENEPASSELPEKDEIKNEPNEDSDVPSAVPAVSDEAAEKTNLHETEPISETAGALPLLKILNLKANEPFYIECNNILLFYPKTLYRFNERGMREYLADSLHEVWVPCNDERELSYLINHPEIIRNP